MFAVDLHAHTRFFHGFPDLGRAYDPVGARLLAAAARYRGLDAVVTTNHDYYRAFERHRDSLAAGEDSFVLLPGIEVTTTDGHALVLGPDPPNRTPPGELTPGEVVDLAHDRDCAAVIAHPYRNSTVREADADFDAVEVNGKGTDPVEWVKRLAARRDLPLVAGSDAHYPVEVGRAYTAVDAAKLTPESVVAAIRDGRVAPRVDRSPGQRVLREAYRVIHGRKGWLGESESEPPEPPGVGTPPGEQSGEEESRERESPAREAN